MFGWAPLTWAWICHSLWMYLTLIGPWIFMNCCRLQVKMSIHQLLRYSVAFLIDGVSKGYTLITIQLKEWVFIVFKQYGFCHFYMPTGAHHHKTIWVLESGVYLLFKISRRIWKTASHIGPQTISIHIYTAENSQQNDCNIKGGIFAAGLILNKPYWECA